MALNRRHFLKRVGAAPAALALTGFGARRGPAGSVALVVDSHHSDYARGVLFGAEEARRSGELLRLPLDLYTVAEPTSDRLEPLLSTLRERGAVAVVAALPDEMQALLEQAAPAAGLVVMDARAARAGAPDRPGVFRTGLAEAAYRRALLHALDGRTVPGYRAVLWDPGLFRYGAEQLNERYRRRFAAGMTGEAWAGWMAVKAVSEAILRARHGGRAGVIERLGGARVAFDGHKGVPLDFTGPGATLAQPVYVIGEGSTMQVDWSDSGGGV